MAKQKKTSRIKDPKKVLAGKARAAQSLRVDGKFTSNSFFEHVKNDAATKGITGTAVFDYYIQNEKEYVETYQTEMLTPNLSFYDIKKKVKTYNGTIKMNGRTVKKATVIKAINTLNQYLRGEHNAVDFYFKIKMSLDGKMSVEMPSAAVLKKILDNGDELEMVMEEYGITVIISDPKKQRCHYVKKGNKTTACGYPKRKICVTSIMEDVTCKTCIKKLK